MLLCTPFYSVTHIDTYNFTYNITCLFQCAWFIVILVSLQMTTGFLLANDQCFDVCTCLYPTTISCHSLGLQSFPVFDLPAGFLSTSHVTVQLNSNMLTEIPFGVFRNFSNIKPIFNDVTISLSLYQNHISRVHNGAFLGLEKVSLYLYLNENSLTSISNEFTRLRGLKELYIEGNPLTVTGLNVGVISQMFYNNAITRISLSSYELLKKVMTYQQNTIVSLDLSDMNETRFDQGLFMKEQTSSLKNMEIKRCEFGDFSEILCNLDLKKFAIHTCKHVNDTTLQGCLQNNTKTLDIRDCATTDAFDPSAFYNAPVTDLVLWGHMTFVPRRLLNHWLNLSTIIFTEITHIVKKEDFEGLTELKNIYFTDDISAVDEEAFNTNLKLEVISLSYSFSLTNLTQSIKHLTHLKTLQLPDMTCSCATMGVVKGGNYSAVNISGNCKNMPGKSIKAYLVNDITACP